MTNLFNQNETLGKINYLQNQNYTSGINSTQKDIDILKNSLGEYQNSFTNKWLKPINLGIESLGSLSGMYLGFKNLGLAKDSLNLAKEQWNYSKQELDDIRNNREKLRASMRR